MVLAAAALFAHAVALVPSRPRCPAPVLCASAEPDLVRLSDIESTLAQTLEVPETPNLVSAKIIKVHAENIAPNVPKIYMSTVAADGRKAAIEKLSRSLDVLEETIQGPMLAGKGLSVADAVLLPSMILCDKTLPQYYGWTEWTDEALFWRRPRLHAWYELILYERAARDAKQQVEARLEEVDFTTLAMDVPTSQIRTFPKHAL